MRSPNKLRPKTTPAVVELLSIHQRRFKIEAMT